MPRIKRAQKRQYWVQVCLIFAQITFAGAWATLFLAFDFNQILVLIYNIAATVALIGAGWLLNEKT